MVVHTHLKKQLSKTFCNSCGGSLDTAELVPVSELPVAIIAHAICSNCNAQSMLTITAMGIGVMPMISDLTSDEITKFLNAKGITTSEVLEIHKKLKKDNIWNLLQKKEKSLEKKQKN